MKIIKKLLNIYWDYIGISIGITPSFSNEGISKTHFILADRHPRKSITWIWSLDFWLPSKWYKISIKNFSFSRQKPIWRKN